MERWPSRLTWRVWLSASADSSQLIPCCCILAVHSMYGRRVSAPSRLVSRSVSFSTTHSSSRSLTQYHSHTLTQTHTQLLVAAALFVTLDSISHLSSRALVSTLNTQSAFNMSLFARNAPRSLRSAHSHHLRTRSAARHPQHLRIHRQLSYNSNCTQTQTQSTTLTSASHSTPPSNFARLALLSPPPPLSRVATGRTSARRSTRQASMSSRSSKASTSW